MTTTATTNSIRRVLKAVEFILIGIPVYLTVILIEDAEIRYFLPGELESIQNRSANNKGESNG